MIEEKEVTGVPSSNRSKEADVRKVRVLWVGLGVYFLIMLNAFRFAYRVPYQILILGGLVNMAIIVAIFVAMRRVYKRLGK